MSGRTGRIDAGPESRTSSTSSRVIGLAALAAAVLATGRHRSNSQTTVLATAPIGPSFPIGGTSTKAWREEILTRVQELLALASWIDAQPDRPSPSGQLLSAVRNQLETARLTAAGSDTGGDGKRPARWTRLVSALGGASFERALGNIDAAEVNLLRLAPDGYVRGQLPSLQAHVNRYLPKDDPRRIRVRALADAVRGQPVGIDRGVLCAAFHAANSQRRRELIRLRSFRNLVVGAAITLFALVIAIAIIGSVHPTWLPLCFLPEDKRKFVCPLAEQHVQRPQTADLDELVTGTAGGADMLVVEFVGLIAATLAAAIALRRMRGTSTPYAVPVALIVLKLPAGALTAVLGLLFMRGGFVPGLTALDSSAQITAWAIIFGYSQQVFTRLVDNKGQDLLQDVAGQGAAGDRETKSR